jgi:hypothetical protein
MRKIIDGMIVLTGDERIDSILRELVAIVGERTGADVDCVRLDDSMQEWGDHSFQIFGTVRKGKMFVRASFYDGVRDVKGS